MRLVFASLLLCMFVSSFSHAQLTWSKTPYQFRPSQVERADFTGDGYPDLIFFNAFGTTLTVLPNTGNGAFDSSHAFTMDQQQGPTGAMALLDFNRDGKTDVALCDGQNVVVLLGNGDGTLTVGQTVPGKCTWIAASDFNRDGNPDLAITVDGSTNSGDNQVIIYLGDGRGGVAGKIVNDNVNFNSSEGNACTLQGPAQAADFTGDKIADLVIAAPCPNFVVSHDALIVGAGDGTGHFTFHKDVEFGFDIGHLRLADVDQDNKRDLVAYGITGAPHFVSETLSVFQGKGDGTFTVQEIASMNSDSAINSGVVADFDGDGIKDAILAVSGTDAQAKTVFSMQFLKGQSDGSYRLTQTSPLANEVMDMIAADYNKDGRIDLALVRPSTIDVWLNQTASSPVCPALSDQRTVNFCSFGSPTGMFHFLATPLDSRQINAVQIYVDGSLKFETPDDLLNTNITLTGGTHRITAKGWDDQGPFSTTVNLRACPNSADRSVKLCLPIPGPVSGTTVHFVASAATSLPFDELQVYIDGALTFRTPGMYLDTFLDLSLGTHQVTLKGWDNRGPFASSFHITVN